MFSHQNKQQQQKFLDLHMDRGIEEWINKICGRQPLKKFEVT